MNAALRHVQSPQPTQDGIEGVSEAGEMEAAVELGLFASEPKADQPTQRHDVGLETMDLDETQCSLGHLNLSPMQDEQSKTSEVATMFETKIGEQAMAAGSYARSIKPSSTIMMSDHTCTPDPALSLVPSNVYNEEVLLLRPVATAFTAQYR
jgi:hypothetical protein